MCKPKNQEKEEFKSERELNPNLLIRIVRAIRRIITRRLQEGENTQERQVIVVNLVENFDTIEEESDEEVLEIEEPNEEI